MFIPLISEPAILTHQNWLDLGVETLAYDLAALLIKPGMDVLLAQPSLAAYTGWPGKVYLDISRVKADEVIRSPFDGSRIKVSEVQLTQLIDHLKPDGVVNSSTLTWEEPTHLALSYTVYSKAGLLHVKDLCYQDSHEPIDASCACPTCSAGLTRAYLHHLSMHVPQLCLRFLTEHNVYSMIARLKDERSV